MSHCKLYVMSFTGYDLCYNNTIDRGFEPMNPFTGLSLESSCFNHLHKRIFTGINGITADLIVGTLILIVKWIDS